LKHNEGRPSTRSKHDFLLSFLHSFPRNRRSPIGAGYSQKPGSGAPHIFMFELGMRNHSKELLTDFQRNVISAKCNSLLSETALHLILRNIFCVFVRKEIKRDSPTAQFELY
jgi:hypothetical protein